MLDQLLNLIFDAASLFWPFKGTCTQERDEVLVPSFSSHLNIFTHVMLGNVYRFHILSPPGRVSVVSVGD